MGGSPSLKIQFLIKPNRIGGRQGCEHMNKEREFSRRSQELTNSSIFQRMVEDRFLCDGQFPVETYQTLGAHGPALVSGLSCSAISLPTSLSTEHILSFSSWKVVTQRVVLASLSSTVWPLLESPSENSSSARHLLLPISYFLFIRCLENDPKSQQITSQASSSQVSPPFSQTPWTQAMLGYLGFTIKSHSLWPCYFLFDQSDFQIVVTFQGLPNQWLGYVLQGGSVLSLAMQNQSSRPGRLWDSQISLRTLQAHPNCIP